jgi:two-component system cell cycle sensor histidine kinase/response regulator CckA
MLGTPQESQESPLEPVSPKVILIAEDDLNLLALAKNLLEGDGYTVLTARDGEEALRLLLHGPAAIDLLLCDVVLSGIHGIDIARFTNSHRPATKIVLYSGQINNVMEHMLDIADRVHILSKPFGAEILRNTVQQVLGIEHSTT